MSRDASSNLCCSSAVSDCSQTHAAVLQRTGCDLDLVAARSIFAMLLNLHISLTVLDTCLNVRFSCQASTASYMNIASKAAWYVFTI